MSERRSDIAGQSPTGHSDSEAALRLADAYAVVATVRFDEDTLELQEDAGSFLSALEHALTGSSGCIDPDEWQEGRQRALAEYGEQLRLGSAS